MRRWVKQHLASALDICLSFVFMSYFERRIIYAKDIMILTGRSRSYAYNNLKQVKEHYGKAKHQLVTIQEFAEFHGITVEDLGLALIPRKSSPTKNGFHS
ncbi:MAG: hypothetical protein ACJLTB_01980 [Algoriphagus aquaeductus]|uniref:hypothetical protein n=2 Tax=Algoriphagus TaxID=246875 RepID=UPI00387A5B98